MNLRFFLVLIFCAAAFSAFAADNGGSANDIEIAVPAHDIARGSLITEADLDYKAVPAARASASVVRAISDIVGKEARRALHTGEALRSSDLKRPTLVAKGSNVTMLFDAPGMQLTAVGRALEEGGEGDSITVLNPTSYRKVEAFVVKAGTVRVGAALPAAKVSEDVAAPQR